jgi:predicted amidohydrolase
LTRPEGFSKLSAGFMRSKQGLRACTAFFIFLLFFASAGACADSRILRVAAVQLEIQQSDLRSFAEFHSHIEALVKRCMTLEPDLIVFPEYTSVFPALIPYYPAIRVSRSVEDGLSRIRAQDPLIDGLRDLFLLNSGLAERVTEEIFATLARRYEVAIIPGTFFAWREREGKAVLVNRLVVYDRSGELTYTQDKVYLTPFEEQIVGIAAGSLEEAEPIVLKGHRIGITICRDTFFSEWLQVYSGVDLWIDIKANGVPYAQEERRRFLRAVPARIEEGNIPYGLTVCLTGSLLEMIWEGESSLARNDPGEETRYVEKAASASEEQILFFSIGERPENPPK